MRKQSVSSPRPSRCVVVACFAGLCAGPGLAASAAAPAAAPAAGNYTNSIGMAFVPIPAGTYRMGCSRSSKMSRFASGQATATSIWW